MRRIWPTLAALSLVSGLAAQVEVAAEPAPRAEFDALLAEFRDAQQAFFKKQQEIYATGGMNALRQYEREANPAKDFIPRFRDGAAKFAPTEYAIPYLTWLLTADDSPDNDTAKDALANLVVDHIESAELESAMLDLERGWMATGKADAEEAIAEVLANNDHAKVKGAALFVRAQIALQGEKAGGEAREAALGNLRQALELAPAASFAPRAEGQIFEQEHLQVGKQAPDIEGTDLDGVEFKLSDYKGKVVLLDFWGNW